MQPPSNHVVVSHHMALTFFHATPFAFFHTQTTINHTELHHALNHPSTTLNSIHSTTHHSTTQYITTQYNAQYDGTHNTTKNHGTAHNKTLNIYLINNFT